MGVLNDVDKSQAPFTSPEYLHRDRRARKGDVGVNRASNLKQRNSISVLFRICVLHAHIAVEIGGSENE